MAPSTEFRRAMKYLRLVRKNLEHAESMTQCHESWSQPADDIDNEDDETSSIPSLFSTSTIHSQSSSTSALTPASIIVDDISIAEADLYSDDENDEDEPLDLKDSIIFIARRVTCQRFAEETAHAFSRARPQLGEAIQHVWSTLNLKYCEVSEKMHVFDEDRRCYLCNVQLCRNCEQCILKNCTLLPDAQEISTKKEPEKQEPILLSNVELLAREFQVEPIPLRRFLTPTNYTDWQPRDSLAAKRIAANCHRSCPGHSTIAEPCAFNRSTCLLHLRHPAICQCTEFLVKPSHSCEKGEFHFCKECYKKVVYQIGSPNTKEVTFKTRIGGQVSLSQYTCTSGHPSPEYVSAICKICRGLCTRPVLNETSSLYKVNGGSEGRPPRWNDGTCPWMLDLIPGVDGSFITPLGRKKRSGRQDFLEKLDEEWRDEWEMLFAACAKSVA